MVYDLRTQRAKMAYRSHLQLAADALLLTANLDYIIAVQDGLVVIFRTEELSFIVAYQKYMTDDDDTTTDDEKLSDTNYYYDQTAPFNTAKRVSTNPLTTTVAIWLDQL